LLPASPGETQNGTNERFNGRFRDECLNMEWFRNRREAAALIETWRVHFNEVRPHSSLSYSRPTNFERSASQPRTPHTPVRSCSSNRWSEELEQVTPVAHSSLIRKGFR
jgi:hypothetical protein